MSEPARVEDLQNQRFDVVCIRDGAETCRFNGAEGRGYTMALATIFIGANEENFDGKLVIVPHGEEPSAEQLKS